jgi:hypothetical protein
VCKSELACILLVAVCIATKVDIKHNALSVSEKLEFIHNVDAHSHMMYTEDPEQLSVPMSLVNIVLIKKHTPAVSNYTQPFRKEFKKVRNFRKLNQC